MGKTNTILTKHVPFRRVIALLLSVALAFGSVDIAVAATDYSDVTCDVVKTYNAEENAVIVDIEAFAKNDDVIITSIETPDGIIDGNVARFAAKENGNVSFVVNYEMIITKAPTAPVDKKPVEPPVVAPTVPTPEAPKEDVVAPSEPTPEVPKGDVTVLPEPAPETPKGDVVAPTVPTPEAPKEDVVAPSEPTTEAPKENAVAPSEPTPEAPKEEVAAPSEPAAETPKEEVAAPSEPKTEAVTTAFFGLVEVAYASEVEESTNTQIISRSRTFVADINEMPKNKRANNNTFELGGVRYLSNNGTAIVVGVSDPTVSSVIIPQIATDTNKGAQYTVTAIAAEAFRGMVNLAFVDIPNSVSTIGAGAFEDCEMLFNLQIPDSVIAIGTNAIPQRTSVHTTDATVAELVHQSFRGQTYLNDKPYPIVKESKYILDPVYRVAYNITAGGDAVVVPYPADAEDEGKIADDIVIGNTINHDGKDYPIVAVGSDAFNDNDVITSVTFSRNLRNISSRAFNSCDNLKTVKFAMDENLTKIDESAFNLCKSLDTAVLPYGLRSIGKNAFSNTALVSAVIPDSVTEIGELAFSFINTLTNATIGKNVKTMGYQTFSKDTALQSIYFKSVPNIDTYVGGSSNTTYFVDSPEMYEAAVNNIPNNDCDIFIVVKSLDIVAPMVDGKPAVQNGDTLKPLINEVICDSTSVHWGIDRVRNVRIDRNGLVTMNENVDEATTFVALIPNSCRANVSDTGVMTVGEKPVIARKVISCETVIAPPKPVEPPVDPVEPPKPVEPPVDPVEPPVDPVEPPVDPVEPPVDPVEPPVNPVEPPVNPVEPPVTPPLNGGDYEYDEVNPTVPVERETITPTPAPLAPAPTPTPVTPPVVVPPVEIVPENETPTTSPEPIVENFEDNDTALAAPVVAEPCILHWFLLAILAVATVIGARDLQKDKKEIEELKESQVKA